MAFDYKKENKEFYLPKLTPSIVVYTIKMSKMGDHRIEGFFDFVVPPLEGLWWQEEDGNPVADIDLQQHFHHEIYLSDPRKTSEDKLKTVIRYPIK